MSSGRSLLSINKNFTTDNRLVCKSLVSTLSRPSSRSLIIPSLNHTGKGQDTAVSKSSKIFVNPGSRITRSFSMSSPKSHKRIIVACDGTWVNSDNGWVRDSWLPWKTGGTLASPSNITRLCRAIQTKSDDGVQQIVYYQGGLGSANNWYSFYIGGYLGEGISENIREAYAFICSVSFLIIAYPISSSISPCCPRHLLASHSRESHHFLPHSPSASTISI